MLVGGRKMYGNQIRSIMWLEALACEVERSPTAAKETALSFCVVLLSGQCGVSGGIWLGKECYVTMLFCVVCCTRC
jgi:hypothetical protein